MKRPPSTPPIRLERATLEGFGRVLLEETSWQVERGRVTVVIGPAGTGKSALLRALGARAPREFKLGGTWLFAGKRATPTTQKRVAFVPQLATGGQRTLADIVNLVDPTRHDVILLDEPDHGLSGADLRELSLRIDSWKRGRAVLVVTHNLEFARRIGDDAALLCAARLRATGALAEVFGGQRRVDAGADRTCDDQHVAPDRQGTHRTITSPLMSCGWSVQMKW